MAKNSTLMALRSALKALRAPGAEADLVSSGAISGLTVGDDGVARFAIDIGDLARDDAAKLLNDAQTIAHAVDGVTRVSAVATRHRAAAAPPITKAPPNRHANPLGLGAKPGAQKPDRDGLKDVRQIIAVASGKGGVGKSTIAANLALALSRRGLRVGILDADIYGPSLPVLFGLSERPDVKDGIIEPVEAHGLKAISIGLIVAADKALAWRGPMVMGAIRQLMNDVNWGTLDILIIDTPPGTGDAHLSLAQSGKLDGAIIVSTPQEMALADVRRGVEFFRKVGVQIYGIIENMAYLEMPDGAVNYLFGKDGAKKAAASLNVPILGELSISSALRQACDSGTPLDQKSDDAKSFDIIASKIIDPVTQSAC